jgi:hypothetical protein
MVPEYHMPQKLKWEDEMPEPVKPTIIYKLLLTEDDKTALLNIINTTTFKGQDALYVSSLIDRISMAPPEPVQGQPTQASQPPKQEENKK